MNGITNQQIVNTLRMMLEGAEVGLLHPARELEPVIIKVQPPKAERSSLEELMIIKSPIPLTLIGVILGYWMFGAFLTATSMIGVIALAGIIVRNS